MEIANLLYGPVGILGGSVFMGWMVGFALKKIFKLIAIGAGSLILLIMYLEHIGIIKGVDYDKIQHIIAATARHAADILSQMVAHVQSQLNTDHMVAITGIGFAGGVVMGIKSG
jgi:uncharacterized membrane protein (Fun14 family)